MVEMVFDGVFDEARRFIAQVLGVKPLRNGATAPDLSRAFGL